MNAFIIIAYLVVLVTLTSFTIVKAQVPNWIRLSLIVAGFWAASAYYFHIDTLRGYPTSEDVKEARMVAIEVIKPAATDVGGIYIWAYEKEKERSWLDQVYGINSNFETPRAYRLPYSKENERKYSSLKKKMKDGYSIVKQKSKKGKTKKGSGSENQVGEE
jgi:hypothetical protein